MFKFISFIFVFTISSFLLNAQDELRSWNLRDGSIIKGSVIEETSDFFIVNSKLGKIKILKSEINHQILDAILQDGSKIIGIIREENSQGFVIESKVGLLKVKHQDIISYKKKLKYNSGEEKTKSKPYFEKREKMSSAYSHAIEPIIDIFFDPTAYTFRQGDLYLSGISLAYGLSNSFLVSSKLLDFAGLNSTSSFNPNVEIKYNYAFLRSNKFDFLSTVGFRFDLIDINAVNVKKYKITYENTQDCKFCKELSRELVETQKNKRAWSRRYFERKNLSTLEGVQYISEFEDVKGWKLKFYSANTWSFLMSRGGRFSAHLGTFLEINQITPEINWFKRPSFRVYTGFDMDLSRKFKLLGEVFYDPDYYNEINNEKYWGVDFGGMYAFSETFRLLVHIQPYIFGFYWRF